MKSSFFTRNKKIVQFGGLILGVFAIAGIVLAATGNPCRLYENGADQKTGNNFSGALPSGWSFLKLVCRRSIGGSSDNLNVTNEYGSNITTTNHLNKDVHIPFAKKKELIKFIQATRNADSALFVGNGYVNTMHPSGGANPGLPQGVQLCAEGQSDPLTIEEATTPILGYSCGGTYETTLPGSCVGTYNRYSYSCTGETFESSGASCSGTLAGIPDASSFGPPTIQTGMQCSDANIFEESACNQVDDCTWTGNRCEGEIQIPQPMANPQFFYPANTLCANIETQGNCRVVPGCNWNSGASTCDGVVQADTPRTDLPQSGLRCGRDIGGNTEASCNAASTATLQQQFQGFGDPSGIVGCTWVPAVTQSCSSLSSSSSCGNESECTWTQQVEARNCNQQTYEIPCETQNAACDWVVPVGTVNCPDFEFESANNPDGYQQTDCLTDSGQFAGNANCNWTTNYSESAEIPGCDLPVVSNACGDLNYLIDNRNGANYPVMGSFSNPLLPGVSTPLDNCWMKADLSLFDSVYQDSSDPVDMGTVTGGAIHANVYIKESLFDVLEASPNPYEDDIPQYLFDESFLTGLDVWTEVDNLPSNDVIGSAGSLQEDSALVKSIPTALKTYCDFHNETENMAGNLITVVVEKVNFTALANGGLNSGARGYNVACGYFEGVTTLSSDWANDMNAFIVKTGMTDFGLTDFIGSTDFSSGFFGAVCPAGWRLPTPEEFDSARSIFGSDGQMQASLSLSDGGYTSANSVWNYFDTNHQHNDIGGYYPIVTKINAGYVTPVANYTKPEFKQVNSDVSVYANQNPTQIPQSGQIRCVERNDTFSWDAGSWSSCVSSNKTRPVNCINADSVNVHAGWCYGINKPATSSACTQVESNQGTLGNLQQTP